MSSADWTKPSLGFGRTTQARFRNKRLMDSLTFVNWSGPCAARMDSMYWLDRKYLGVSLMRGEGSTRARVREGRQDCR